MTEQEPRAAEPPRLVPLAARLLALTAVRLALGLIGLAAAQAAGAEASAAGAAFAFGAGVSAAVLISDRRGLLRGQTDPAPAPAGAARASLLRAVAAGLFPSTVGVAALAAVALAANAVLAALLAGVLAGMALAGVAGLIGVVAWQQRAGAVLYASGRSLYRKPRP
jgi:hypothetical protein